MQAPSAEMAHGAPLVGRQIGDRLAMLQRLESPRSETGRRNHRCALQFRGREAVQRAAVAPQVPGVSSDVTRLVRGHGAGA